MTNEQMEMARGITSGLLATLLKTEGFSTLGDMITAQGAVVVMARCERSRW